LKDRNTIAGKDVKKEKDTTYSPDRSNRSKRNTQGWAKLTGEPKTTKGHASLGGRTAKTKEAGKLEAMGRVLGLVHSQLQKGGIKLSSSKEHPRTQPDKQGNAARGNLLGVKKGGERLRERKGGNKMFWVS